MALEEYKSKRKFDRTPEPRGGSPQDKKLYFVVQKHHASHLHYDFRIELRGVLKSWAVPKGLSMDPSVKRLAMLVEDHPWDYHNFEGIIPSGYGAGTVIVWDHGTYLTPVIKTKDKKEQEHSITSQFWKGQISFHLNGKKLKGEFKISRAKDKGEKAWYISKVKDKYATSTEILLKDRSVISGKTLDQVAANPTSEWQSHKPAYKKESKSPYSQDTLYKKGLKASMPAKVDPMVCTLIKDVFTDPEWIYELKIDGYRTIAHVNNAKVNLYSRAGLNFNKYYPLIVDAFQQISKSVIIDGEIAVLDENGKPNFDMLQKYKGNDTIVFYAFDIIWIDGYNVTGLDLLTRKSILKNVLPETALIRFTEHFDDGINLFEQVKEMQLEGIVAKRRESTYESGKRSKDWLKLPTEIKQEFVIGGWSESESGRSFRSLLFGAYENNKFYFVGHAGLGYKDKEMAALLTKLEKLETKKNPFVNEVDASTTVHYIKPVLVGNFKFATWTAQGKIRKPAIFLGLRNDKDPKSVIRDVPVSAPKVSKKKDVIKDNAKENKEKAKKNKEKVLLTSDSNWHVLDKVKITSKDSIQIDNKEVLLTNVEKKLWPTVTKADLIQYYHSIADFILPHLKDRAQSLHIKHIKPTAPGMYIKDMEGRAPEWAEIFTTPRKHKKEGKRDIIDYLVCQDKATLLYMINLGCIDVNPWTSRIDKYLKPDYIIIDLDPSDNDFEKVIKSAQVAKKVFDKFKIKAYPKTSGKTGIHLYIPCENFSFPEARTIAENLTKKIHKLIPDITTVENSISERGDKVFLDYNQNDEADTVAAPYSVRPSSKPTVSTPLDWSEINKKLKPENFHIHNTLDRVNTKDDIFKGVLNKKIMRSNSSILRMILAEK